MLDLKNIYKEIIEEIHNMNDKQMIEELVGEGCIFIGKMSNIDMKVDYSFATNSLSLPKNKFCNDYSEYEGAMAA